MGEVQNTSSSSFIVEEMSWVNDDEETFLNREQNVQQILRCLMIPCCILTCVFTEFKPELKACFWCRRPQSETPYSGAGAGTMR